MSVSSQCGHPMSAGCHPLKTKYWCLCHGMGSWRTQSEQSEQNCLYIVDVHMGECYTLKYKKHKNKLGGIWINRFSIEYYGIYI